MTTQCDPPLYKFDNEAWTLGGPVLIPGTELQQGPEQAVLLLLAGHPAAHRSRRPEPAPDADRARAQGRLLADVRHAGAARVHPRPAAGRHLQRRPRGGPACFPDNIIPANRIDPIGQALLNLFPLPNADDPTAERHTTTSFQTVQDWPRNDQVLRIDWNVAPQTTAYGRVQWGYEKRAGRRLPPRVRGRVAAACRASTKSTPSAT